MKYMFKDIFVTLFHSIPAGLLIGGVIYAVKKYLFKLKKSKTEYISEILFWAYSYVLIYRTVLSRKSIYEPLSDVFGGWTVFVHRYTGLDYQVIGNIIMFAPFALLLILSFYSKKGTKRLLACAAVFSAAYSLAIETVQLITSRGTFQLSDIFYNTVGGLIGAVICILFKKIRKRVKSNRRS